MGGGNPAASVGGRIEWLDAMRGIAMLMVVFCHQISGVLGLCGRLMIDGLFSSIMMPLFFFIGGFFYMRKPDQTSSLTKIGKSFMRLIVPTLICWMLWAWMFDRDMDWFALFKNGYWFLFTFFLLETCLMPFRTFLTMISRKWQLISCICFIVLSFKSVNIAYYCGLLPNQWLNLAGVPFALKYAPFFVFGILMKLYWREICAICHKPAVELLLVAACFVIFTKIHFLNVFGYLIVIVLGCIVMSRYENYFSHRTMSGRILCLVGTNTLGIYLLHYFVLDGVFAGIQNVMPAILIWVSNPLLELLIGGFMAMICTVLTLGLIKVIEVFPIIAMLMIGKIPRKKAIVS